MKVGAAVPGNRYDAPGENRAERVQFLFERIARRYDRINDLISFGMHRLWKRRLAALSEFRPQERAIDLCCGTGDVARALAAVVPPGGRKDAVVGVDFAEEMLELARRKSPDSTSPTFLRADALALPFPDGAFDLVTCAYGLRNLADLDAGLREAFRVLRPGGRLASLEFGRPASPLLSAGYFGYLRLVLPIYGSIFFGDSDAYGYIFTTVSRFPGQRELADRMRQAGFDPVEVHDLMGGVMGICVARKGASSPGGES